MPLSREFGEPLRKFNAIQGQKKDFDSMFPKGIKPPVDSIKNIKPKKKIKNMSKGGYIQLQ